MRQVGGSTVVNEARTREIVAEQAAGDWGPWGRVIEEVVEACTSQVRKLSDALGRDANKGLDEFHNDATHLYRLTDELVERCEDVRRWHCARTEMERGSQDGS